MQTVIGYDDTGGMPAPLDILPFASNGMHLPAGLAATHPQTGLLESSGLLGVQRPQAVNDVSQMVSAVVSLAKLKQLKQRLIFLIVRTSKPRNYGVINHVAFLRRMLTHVLYEV
jgi:hypothetical protein